MAPPRQLPAKKNPLLTDGVPEYTDLVSRRRLGQTKLTARMVAGATSDAEPSELGVFDYAHLRAPVPKGIVSGIFARPSPASYFLMRRSSDGYVSATGMFKATFPYAEAEEEEEERQYIKSLSTTSPEETAGNIWVSPEQALVLAEEYSIVPWIRALLDPSDIQVSSGPESSPPKKISAPPKFFHGLAPPTPTSLPRSSRSRRSTSPTKSTGSKRGVTSPRKRSAKVSQQSASQTPSSSAKLSSSPGLPNGDTLLAPAVVEAVVKEPAVVLAPVEEEPKIKINVDQGVKAEEDGVEATETKVEVEVPVAGELPSAEDAARMVAEAKEMVKAAAATVVASAPSAANKGKRKADDIAVSEEEDKENMEVAASDEPRAKRVKTEVELKKERVRKRALLGISATLAVGALVPYVMGML